MTRAELDTEALMMAAPLDENLILTAGRKYWQDQHQQMAFYNDARVSNWMLLCMLVLFCLPWPAESEWMVLTGLLAFLVNCMLVCMTGTLLFALNANARVVPAGWKRGMIMATCKFATSAVIGFRLYLPYLKHVASMHARNDLLRVMKQTSQPA